MMTAHTPKFGEIRAVKNLRNANEYAAMAELIRQLKGNRRIVFAPANGNWGDGLINYGSRQFFNHFSIEFDELTRDQLKQSLQTDTPDWKQRVCVVGGGGSWCKNWGSTRPFTQSAADIFKSVVVLPSTFELPPCDRDANVHYFARDRNFSALAIPRSQFCHDMALFIEQDVFEPTEKAWRLAAMRMDREGNGLDAYFAGNVDLSRLGHAGTKIVSPFFQMINLFNVVLTDRMHVGIAASMLGKSVELVGGNYPKSRAVFEASLNGNFNNTRYLSSDDFIKRHQLKASTA